MTRLSAPARAAPAPRGRRAPPGLCDLEAALVQRLADDRAGQVDLAERGQRSQILERGRSRRSRRSSPDRRGRGPRPRRDRGRSSMPSRSMSENTNRAHPARSSGSNTASTGISVCSVHPAAASVPPRASTDTTTRSPWRATPRRGGLSHGTPPFRAPPGSAPASIAASTASALRSPPPTCTGTVDRGGDPPDVLEVARLTGRAPSRSTTCSARAPAWTQRWAASSGSGS